MKLVFQPSIFGCYISFREGTLPETNIFAPESMDAWKTIVSFWDFAYFQGRFVGFRECSLEIMYVQ